MRRVPLKNWPVSRPHGQNESPLPPDAEALASILAEALVQDIRRYGGGVTTPPWKVAEVIEISRQSKKKIKTPRQEGGRK
jgi:hypothetical protein